MGNDQSKKEENITEDQDEGVIKDQEEMEEKSKFKIFSDDEIIEIKEKNFEISERIKIPENFRLRILEDDRRYEKVWYGQNKREKRFYGIEIPSTNRTTKFKLIDENIERKFSSYSFQIGKFQKENSILTREFIPFKVKKKFRNKAGNLFSTKYFRSHRDFIQF